MKSIIAAILAFSLSGCFYQSVNTTDIKYATRECGGVEKIEQINSHFIGEEMLKCEGKAWQTLKDK